MTTSQTIASAGLKIIPWGFWHPFGPHCQEKEQQILKRKASEVEANGWTLWSFQHRKTLRDWYQVLSLAKPERVYVFCSAGGGRSPAGRTSKCQSYRLVDGAEWQPMPRAICVPHSFPDGREEASAFVVQGITDMQAPAEVACPVKWYCPSKGPWRQDRVPTRGEYLVRPGGDLMMRKIRAILELKPPYLAFVRPDQA